MIDSVQPPPGVVHVFVEGRVQGVGYRYFLRGQAQRLGVSGWVRNRADGSVEALARGGSKQIENLLTAMRRGPPGSDVLSLRVADPEQDFGPDTGLFVILPTL